MFKSITIALLSIISVFQFVIYRKNLSYIYDLECQKNKLECICKILNEELLQSNLKYIKLKEINLISLYLNDLFKNDKNMLRMKQIDK